MYTVSKYTLQMMMLLLVLVSALLVHGFELNEIYTGERINTSDFLSEMSSKSKGACWDKSPGV